ncbi:MAG: hypothetical protein LBK76_11850 [Verrucomicrobiales bacterium]|nr:hypothetical protein [Verrucomicrobiales bacterium]
MFRRLKDFRRLFTRYDKLDRMFAAYVSLALIVIIPVIDIGIVRVCYKIS